MLDLKNLVHEAHRRSLWQVVSMDRAVSGPGESRVAHANRIHVKRMLRDTVGAREAKELSDSGSGPGPIVFGAGLETPGLVRVTAVAHSIRIQTGLTFVGDDARGAVESHGDNSIPV
jgi:hypothetical protein